MASAGGGIDLKLSPKLVYEALAANPYGKPQTAKLWSDIDPSLPAKKILVYGPPSTSDTRDSFEELILLEGCKQDAAMKALKDSDEEKFDQVRSEEHTSVLQSLMRISYAVFCLKKKKITKAKL